MGVDFTNVQDGFATEAGPLMTDLLKTDSRPLEPGLKEVGNFFPPMKKVPFSRYTDPAYAALEMEHIWKKRWQMVCREEDIPEIGDRKMYEVGLLSYIIIRSGKEEFRALQNACLHRGTRLCHGQSSGSSIKCPFHAWEWNCDGSLKNIPSRWDFPEVKTEEYRLPEAKIDRWGGFLFINPDPNSGPLSDELGVLPQHFSAREAADRYTFSGFRKKLRGNWKQAQEAFLEAYHVIETHPNIMTYNGDTQTRYDVWDDGKSQVSRSLTPSAVPSGHLGDDVSALQSAEDSLRMFATPLPGVELPRINSGLTGRKEVADWRREVFGPAIGADFSEASDSYMLDSNQYFVFPNFFPWYGEGLPLIYQFLPLGTNPNECVVEIRLSLPVPTNGPRPPSAEIVELDFDMPVSNVLSMGVIGGIFDQDFSNIPLVQLGLRSTNNPDSACTFGRYQESRISAFYDLMDRLIPQS